LADSSLIKFHQGLKPALLPFYLTLAAGACLSYLSDLITLSVSYAHEEVSKGLAALPNSEHVVDLFPYIKSLVHRIGALLQCCMPVCSVEGCIYCM
jgi:hypothetical protein